MLLASKMSARAWTLFFAGMVNGDCSAILTVLDKADGFSRLGAGAGVF